MQINKENYADIDLCLKKNYTLISECVI